jgi:hypothetical protein
VNELAEKDGIPSVICNTKNLKELFELVLTIPHYQRSYEWGAEHVKYLLTDTYDAFQKSKENPSRQFLMGSVILHAYSGNMEIIDGQQRLVTFTILLYAMGKQKKLPLLEHSFCHVVSRYYIDQARIYIKGFLADKQQEITHYRDFLEEMILFTVLTMTGANALDLAYTFFDSMNSKGKALSDFDLLKAHHLMFIPENQEALAKSHNDYWLEKQDQHAQVFSILLRRIRLWSRGLCRDLKQDRCNFHEFVSAIEPHELSNEEHFFNRYMQPAVFRSWYRKGNNLSLLRDFPDIDPEDALPMEIPQTIEGGDAFFLYAKRYHTLYNALFGKSQDLKPNTSIQYVRDIANAMPNDYLKNAYTAVMLLYHDKFGESRIIEVATCVEMIVSHHRYKVGAVRIEGTLTHVRDYQLIPVILEATQPSHVIARFYETCAHIPKPSIPDKGTVKVYYDSLTRLYKGRKSLIGNLKIISKIDSIYYGSQEEVNDA